MAVITSDPFDTMGTRRQGPRAPVTGTYRGPDGVHTRFKEGAALPAGYELVDGVKAIAEAPENRAEPEPENKAEKPARKTAKSPGSVAAKLG